jgi:hypothetical protein
VISGHGAASSWLVGDDDLVSCLAVEPPAPTMASRPPGHARTMVAVRAAGWSGVVLDPVRLSGRLVRPVVDILPAGWDRVSAGVGPELDRSTLAMWESWPAGMGASPPGAPVRIVGFVAEGSWRCAVATAAWLAAVVVRGRSGPLASAERTVAVRHREEFLFAAVISQGRWSSRLSACKG